MYTLICTPTHTHTHTHTNTYTNTYARTHNTQPPKTETVQRGRGGGGGAFGMPNWMQNAANQAPNKKKGGLGFRV
jgi:hypothetical protein